MMNSVATITILERRKEEEMAEFTKSTSTIISRRSTRLFEGDQDAIEGGNTGQVDRESGQVSEEKEQERCLKLQKPQAKDPPFVETPALPLVDFGMDLCVFPTTKEGMSDQVAKSLHASKADKSRGEGRPPNFGTVLPGAVYRSSCPKVEDFLFLNETLGLKTVISLTQKNLSPEFTTLLKENGIRHVVIDMQGTQKEPIPDFVMHSVMEVALDKASHPLLIHCNQGRHRTGCVVAVIRHAAGWGVDSILDEYRGFAETKPRECDLNYIKDYDIAALQGLFSEKITSRTSAALESGKMHHYIIASTVIIIFWVMTIWFWGRQT